MDQNNALVFFEGECLYSSRRRILSPRACRSGPANNFCEATFALRLTASYHSPRARQGSAFSAMRVAAFGQ
jgi:hypothetical protein